MYSIKKANDCRGTSDGTFPKPWRFIARIRLLKRPQGGENLEGEWTDLLCTTIRLVLAAVVGPASSRLPRVAFRGDISRRQVPRGDQLCAAAFG